MCVQGNDEISAKELEKISKEMGEKIKELCGGEFRIVYRG